MRGLEKNCIGRGQDTTYIHTYNIWTDITTIRPNRPSGPIRWKFSYTTFHDKYQKFYCLILGQYKCPFCMYHQLHQFKIWQSKREPLQDELFIEPCRFIFMVEDNLFWQINRKTRNIWPLSWRDRMSTMVLHKIRLHYI